MSKPTGKRVKLGQMLVAAGAIEPTQLTAALEDQKARGGLLGMAMLRLGIVDESTLIRALAGQLGLPVVKLQGKQISAEVIDLVPVEIVEKHRCLPLLVHEKGESRVLYLGMEDPSDADVVAEICTLVGMNVQAVLVGPADLDEGIYRHYQCAGFGASLLAEATLPPVRDNGYAASPKLSPSSRMLDPNAEDMAPKRDAKLGPEPSFVGVDELAVDDPNAPLEFIDAPAINHLSARSGGGGASASSDAMLRAVAPLVVEKGVFSRDELVARLKAMSESGGGS